MVGEIIFDLDIYLTVYTLQGNYGKEAIFGGPLCCCSGGVIIPNWVSFLIVPEYCIHTLLLNFYEENKLFRNFQPCI